MTIIDLSLLFPLLDLQDSDLESQRLSRPLWIEVHCHRLVVYSDDFTQQPSLCVNFLSEVSGLPDHRSELPAFPVEFSERTELTTTARAELADLGDTVIEMIGDAYLDCSDEETESWTEEMFDEELTGEE